MSILYTLCLKFLSASSLSEIEFCSVPCKTEDDQIAILSATYLHRCHLKHRVSHRFTVAFFKKLLKHIEDNHWDISDKLFESFGDLLSHPYPDSHRHYKLPKRDDVFLTLAERSELVVDGTTGLRTWQASFLMVEWIAANSSMLKSRRVVELGCGSGLVGLALCVLADPASCVLTDYHPSVLEALPLNLTINMDMLHDKPTQLLLNWEKVHEFGLTEEQKAILEGTDIILASDVTYDSRIIEPLLTTVKEIMKLSQSGCHLYVSLTIRNPETYNFLLSSISRMGLMPERLTFAMPEDTTFISDEKGSMEIIKITQTHTDSHRLTQN